MKASLGKCAKILRKCLRLTWAAGRKSTIAIMFWSPYFPHVVYAIALTTISINLKGRRSTTEDEKSRIGAQISILEGIKQQLQSNQPLSTGELERLKKLARPTTVDSTQGVKQSGEAKKDHEVGWGSIFSGKKPAEAELSKWDKQELDSRAYQVFSRYFLVLTILECSSEGAGEMRHSNSYTAFFIFPAPYYMSPNLSNGALLSKRDPNIVGRARCFDHNADRA